MLFRSEAPPVADQASLFRGRLPNSGYAVSAVWSEPTVYPFLGFPRTPFLTVAENLPLYRQSRAEAISASASLFALSSFPDFSGILPSWRPPVRAWPARPGRCAHCSHLGRNFMNSTENALPIGKIAKTPHATAYYPALAKPHRQDF